MGLKHNGQVLLKEIRQILSSCAIERERERESGYKQLRFSLLQIKSAKKTQGTAERRRKDLEVKRSSQLSDMEELHLELRQAPAPPSPSSTPTPTTTTAPTTTTVTTAIVETHAKEPEEKIDSSTKEHIPKADSKKADKEAEGQHEEKEVTLEQRVEPKSADDASRKESKDEARKSREMKTTAEQPGTKEKRKSQELKEKVKPQETKEKRKSQELREKEKSQETREKRKSQELKEKRKSQEVTAVESQAQDTPVLPQAPAEPPANKTKEPDEVQQTPDVAKAPEELAAAKPDKQVADVAQDQATESAVREQQAEAPEAPEAQKEDWDGSADGQGEGEEKEAGPEVTLKDSLKGAGEELAERKEPQVKGEWNFVLEACVGFT